MIINPCPDTIDSGTNLSCYKGQEGPIMSNVEKMSIALTPELAAAVREAAVERRYAQRLPAQERAATAPR
jgi:hypothetical protein